MATWEDSDSLSFLIWHCTRLLGMRTVFFPSNRLAWPIGVSVTSSSQEVQGRVKRGKIQRIQSPMETQGGSRGSTGDRNPHIGGPPRDRHVLCERTLQLGSEDESW
jgi:hypothetical protein